MRKKAARTYAAYHVVENGQEWYFKTSPGEELLVACKKLRSYVAAEKGTAPDLFIEHVYEWPTHHCGGIQCADRCTLGESCTGKVRGVLM